VKLALVGPFYPFRGGLAHHSACLAQALARGGHELQLHSFHRFYPGWLYPGRSSRDPSLRPQLLPAERLLDPLAPWSAARAAQRILAAGCEAAVMQWWTPFWAPVLAPLAAQLRRAGLPVAFIVHNVLPHERRPLDAWLARRTLAQATVCLVHSAAQGQRLAALLGDSAAPIVHAPHPLYDLFRDGWQPPHAARARLGLPQDEIILLAFGLVRPYKGLDVLLAALAQLARQGRAPFLAVAGEWWQARRPFERRIDRLGLGGRVRIEDRYIPDEQAALWFSAADLFSAAYTAGTQSGALKLALGWGLPCIASPYAIDPGEADYPHLWRVPAGDVTALAAAIAAAQAVRPPRRAPDAAAGWDALAAAVLRSLEG